VKVQAPMRSGSVVVLGVHAENALQVAPAEDEDVVETLSSNGADPALRDGIRLRGPSGRLHNGEALGPENLVEGARELGISIPDQDVLVLEGISDREVASLLSDSSRVGSACRADYMDPPCGELDEEHDVERSQEDSL
jgi:hypothetical protein